MMTSPFHQLRLMRIYSTDRGENKTAFTLDFDKQTGEIKLLTLW